MADARLSLQRTIMTVFKIYIRWLRWFLAYVVTGNKHYLMRALFVLDALHDGDRF